MFFLKKKLNFVLLVMFRNFEAVRLSVWLLRKVKGNEKKFLSLLLMGFTFCCTPFKKHMKLGYRSVNEVDSLAGINLFEAFLPLVHAIDGLGFSGY